EIEAGGATFATLFAGTGTSVAFPRLAFQDLPWKWRVFAHAEDAGSGTTFRRLYRSRALPIAGLNPPPPTRGRPAVAGGRAARGLTDGNCLAEALPQGGPAPTRIEVDLGAAVPLSVVYLYELRFAAAGGISVSIAPAPGAV